MPALRPVGSVHELCVPTSAGRTGWLEGLDAFRNRSDAEVVVEEARWGEERLDVREISYVLRDAESRFAGLGVRHFPPSFELPIRPGSPGWAWRHRQPVDGARLPPSAPGEYYVAIVAFEGRRGAGGPLEIRYAVDGEDSETLTTRVTLRAARRC